MCSSDLKDFPFQNIRINGKEPSIDTTNKNSISLGNVESKEVIYLFNTDADLKVSSDTTFKSWITAGQFEKMDTSRQRTYWMGLEIQMPPELHSQVFFLPVPNPYVTRVYVNNQLVYDLMELKKNGKDWLTLQNMVPVVLNKKINSVFFYVCFTDEHSVFSLKDGGTIKSYVQLIDNINYRSQLVSQITGLSIFYGTITLLYFLLYFLGLREKKYFLGALFTISCGSTLFILSQMIYGTGFQSVPILIVFFCVILFTPVSFMLFIMSFFHYAMPRLMKWLFSITIFLVILALVSQWLIESSGYLDIVGITTVLASGITLLMALFYPIRFVVLAFREKKPNAMIILIGMFTPLLLLFYSFIESTVFKSSYVNEDFLTVFLIIPVPLSILISLVRD